MPRSRLILAIVFLGIGFAPSSFEPLQDASSSHDYLEQAFSELNKNPSLPVDTETQEKIQRITSGLRKKATEKQFYAIDQTEAAKLGNRAFSAIAPLLRDPDPWVRESAMGVLFQLDRQRSMPFLVGMLLDQGEIQYRDDDEFIDTTVSREAAGFLAGAFRGALDFNIPLDEIGQPQAEERAKQKWWAYHLRYCDWKDTTYGRQCWLNDQALYSHLPADKFAERLKSEPERFKYIPVVWPQASQYSRTASSRQSLHLNLIFENWGTQMPVPEGPERGTHIFRLIGPDGREVPPTPKLNEIVKSAVLNPPVYTWNSYSWDIDLGAAYRISRPGRYRIYYRYEPPKSLRNTIYGQTFELTFWNGREYVNYFDFLVR
jgi:hypothetical protein